MKARTAVKMVATASALWFSIGTAFAEQYEAVPTNWRLENYVSSHSVKLWFTGAPGCDDGAIEGAFLSQDDLGRLWSLILSAKAMNKKVGLFYNASGGVCTINSFYIDQ